MIQSAEELQQALDQLARLHKGLASLRSDLTPFNAKTFTVMAEGPIDQIKELQAQVDAYTGSVLAARHEASLWLRVQGRNIGGKTTPTSVLTALLDTLRKGITNVTEFILTGGLSSRPTSEIKQACDLRVVGLIPGSLMVGVNLRSTEQQSLPLGQTDQFTAHQAAKEALDSYLKVATWAASDEDVGELSAVVEDSGRRRVILTALARLVPKARGPVDSISLESSYFSLPGPVTLIRTTKNRIGIALDSSEQEMTEQHTGDLREIDLDKKTFILRNPEDPTEVRCEFDDELLETAKEALDKSVQVVGVRHVDDTRRRSARLQVRRIEILEDEEEVLDEDELED